MSYMNRLANVNNQYQGDYKRVLCVCSAGLLRSPTIAYVLSQEPYNCNTRAAGMSEEYGLIIVDDYLINWAQEIVFADKEHEMDFIEEYGEPGIPIQTLNLPDKYPYRHPELIQLIKERYVDSR